MRSRPSFGVLAAVIVAAACAPTPRAQPPAPETALRAALEPATAEPEPAPPTDPRPGAILGSLLGASVAPVVPPVEQGIAGVIQAAPHLLHTTARDLDQRWLHISRMGDPAAQFEAVRASSVRQRVCAGAVDLRALEGHGLPPFRWRDRVRDRTSTSPVMARILIEAYTRLREEIPEALVALGDLSQPGCGQLRHGVVVRDLEGSEAEALAGRARLHGGSPIVVEHRRAADWFLELERFESPHDPIRVVHRIIGRDEGAPGQTPRLRVESVRYWSPVRDGEEDAELSRTLEGAASVMAAGVRVRSRRVAHWTPEGGSIRLWEQHWVSASRKRQVRTLSHKRLERRVVRAALVELSIARYQPKKPGSFPAETLWVHDDRPLPEGDASAGTSPWVRWQAVYEAGHVTHTSGRDADIAYLNTDNARQFARDPGALDPARTWRWLELVAEAAESAGTPLESVLVDRAIRRRLAEAPGAAASPLWKRIKRVGGHGGHHHLRLALPSPQAERAARAWLADLKDSAARTPEVADGSSPTPSR